MREICNEIRRCVVGHTPLIYLLSSEEGRVRRALEDVADGRPIREWSCIDGLDGADPEATRDPVEALRLIAADTGSTFYLLKDLAPFMERPEVIRSLRDTYYSAGETGTRFVFVVSPVLMIPDALQKEMHLIEVPPPDEEEIQGLVASICAQHTDYDLPEGAQRETILALKGLTETEIRHVVQRALQLRTTDKEKLLDEIFQEKRTIVKKSGYLEFAPPRWDIDGIGGLDRLKEWLIKRQHMFSKEALDTGIPVPKGILIMGVSGCGKSLSVKTVSNLWGVPMFRLDMNLVFSGMYGSPEEAFHKALRTIESVAPAVLWVDEIENALGIEEDGLQISTHIFSAFLTWMQEKPPLIFIAATANRIQALPAEIIRKGRFDEVFFCDLPVEKERVDIFKIHLSRNDAELDDFDFKTLAIMSDGWNGAEIEQAVISARTSAFYDGRTFTRRDLEETMATIVPLSDTMEQQIKAIRSWAFSRATPASRFSRAAKRR